MSSPRSRARKCFALAARAGTPGEREAAITRGMAIINRHELDPDEFDIPGRERRAVRVLRDYADALIDDVFEQKMRDDRWKARVNAHERGRDRFRVFTSDMP